MAVRYGSVALAVPVVALAVSVVALAVSVVALAVPVVVLAVSVVVGLLVGGTPAVPVACRSWPVMAVLPGV